MTVLNPSLGVYAKIRGSVSDSLVMEKCMSQCTGCQCRANIFSTEQIFEEIVVNPLEHVFSKLLGKISPQQNVSAAKCNCTSCNSCRCDCSCRSMPGDTAEIWQ